MDIKVLALVGASALALSACGQTQMDRGLSGAGIGAATGAAGAALLDGDVVGGAVLGGLVGGAAGVFTSDQDVYLGEPLWRRRY